MSSRNQFLSDDERAVAPELYAILSDIANEVQDGQQDYAALEEEGRSRLSETGFDVDYVAIRRAENMQVPDRDCDEIVVLAAAMMGETRLLDNVVVTI